MNKIAMGFLLTALVGCGQGLDEGQDQGSEPLAGTQLSADSNSVRYMFDGVTAGDLPRSAQMVAGYIDGRYAWSSADWARFPHAAHVTITVNGNSNHGDVLDVESGDATVSQVRGWVERREKAGARWHAIYCSRSIMPEVQRALQGLSAGIWVADWTGSPHPVPGAVAVQYKNTPGYDESAVYQASWHP